MATIIIIAILGVLLCIAEADSFIDFILLSLAGIFISLFVSIPIMIALPMSTYEKHYSLNIENLQDNNGVKGSFYLGCGQFKDRMNYVFYYNENGLYKMKQVDYQKAFIKIADNRPKVNVTKICPVEGAFINYFAFDTDILDETYVIEVPQGTIKNNYNLDAN